MKTDDKITPEILYQLLILDVLIKSNGSEKREVILEKLKRNYGDWLSKKDLEDYESGNAERWKNRASWAREHLKKQEYLRSDSPHGFWEITDTGKTQYKEWLKYLTENLPSNKKCLNSRSP